MVSKLDEERLCLCPLMKLLTNNLLNSLKDITVLGGILLNHTRVGPLRVVGKALHIISSGTPWRCMVVLKVAMWLNGSRVPSYESKEGILNLGGRGWALMEGTKGESVLWTKSSTGFILFILSFISSIVLLIWSISLSKWGTLLKGVPLDWLSNSTFLPSWLWACPPVFSSQRRFLMLSSLTNSWFWRVNSAIVAAMDCMCWTEGGYMVGTDWRLPLLSWGPGLVALDLVRTISVLCRRKKLQNPTIEFKH